MRVSLALSWLSMLPTHSIIIRFPKGSASVWVHFLWEQRRLQCRRRRSRLLLMLMPAKVETWMSYFYVLFRFCWCSQWHDKILHEFIAAMPYVIAEKQRKSALQLVKQFLISRPPSTVSNCWFYIFWVRNWIATSLMGWLSDRRSTRCSKLYILNLKIVQFHIHHFMIFIFYFAIIT